MTSDGFNYRIGGIENKKFLYNGFLKLKINANDINIENKRKYFQNSIQNWKGNNLEFDNILILGFKV
jgi:hypothetical protein